MTATAEHALESDVAPQPFALIDPEKQLEWVNGHAEVKEMAGARHGRIETRLITEIGIYLKANPIGELYASDTTFTIGNRERMPDISFVAAARIPPEGDPVGIWTIAPDLAVEVISPNDLHEAVIEKIREYLAAGVRQVWLVSPQFKTVTIYDSPTQTTTLTEADELTSEELLPGFRCPVRALFQHVGQVPTTPDAS
jgi:Uma2 family endonuclease